MPRTTRPAAYSPEYELLLRKAHSTGFVTIPCGSDVKSKQLRSKLYSYFTALRRATSSQELVEMADALNLAPSADGLALEITLKAQAWDSLAIRKALGLAPDTEIPCAPAVVPAPEQPDMMVERLRKLRTQEADKLT